MKNNFLNNESSASGLSFCLFFCQIQLRVAYKNVAYKKACKPGRFEYFKMIFSQSFLLRNISDN